MQEYVTSKDELAELPDEAVTLQITDKETKEIFRTRAKIAEEPDELADPAPLTVVRGPHENVQEQWYIEVLDAERNGREIDRELLHDNDIKHTLCKVGRPQSNGKIERFFQTYEKHRQRFGTLDEFLVFYNEERPHMSLDWDNLETPADAFDRLLPPPTDGFDDPLATEVSTDE